MTKELSKRASKTLARIKNGEFYSVYGERARKSLDELEAANLIRGAGRWISIGAFYVPSTGYVPMFHEAFEASDNYKEALIREAAPDLLEASKALLTACEVDCGPVENDDGDDESVGASLDGPMALTFGHMRRAAAAIAKAEGRA